MAAAARPEASVKAEAKEKEVEQTVEHIECKTWVLRVSIHCEGCKRKVRKILTAINGVYTTDIDQRQHKVVVTGDVDAQTLIRKLEKNGKHAELWPEPKADQKEKKQKNKATKTKDQQNQEHQTVQESSSEVGSNNPAEKEAVKFQESSKNKESENGSGSGTCKNVEINNGGGAVHVSGQVKESKQPVVVRQNVPFPAGIQSPAGGDKKVGVVETSEDGGGAVEKSGSGTAGGTVGKKKKKKGHKRNSSNNVNVVGEGGSELSGEIPAGIGSPMNGPFPSPASYSLPRQHGCQFPLYPHYPPPQHQTPPAYAVSYNTAYPTPAYSASHYAPATPYSYSYMHPGMASEMPQLPSDVVDSYPPQPADSFDIFSEENPNACSIM